MTNQSATNNILKRALADEAATFREDIGKP